MNDFNTIWNEKVAVRRLVKLQERGELIIDSWNTYPADEDEFAEVAVAMREDLEKQVEKKGQDRVKEYNEAGVVSALDCDGVFLGRTFGEAIVQLWQYVFEGD